MTVKDNAKRSSFILPTSSFFNYCLNAIYLLVILLALPWLLYQRLRHGKYREGFRAKFLGETPTRHGDRPCLWLHAVSVGEVVLLDPILKRWRERHPDWEIVISTTTQTGYALARKKFSHPPPLAPSPAPAVPRPVPPTIFYCPLDFTWAVKRAMCRIRPTLLVLTELELWPNLIAAAKQHGAKVAVINGRLGEKSFRGYRRFRGWLRPILQRLDLVAAQNEEYAERFVTLGASRESVQITGSIKFDGARTNRQNSDTQALAQLVRIHADDIIFLAGSTQDPEEKLALRVFQRLAGDFPKLRLILVPRHPERFGEVAAMLEKSGLPFVRRSSLSPASFPEPPALPRILLIDAIGELSAWWGAAHIAFVGGSLTRRGGQNMIEPAAYGAAIAFGPNTWNFRDVVQQMLGRKAAVVVQNEAELEAFVRRCLTDNAFAGELGARAQQLVVDQQGAADRTVELLERLPVEQTGIRRAAA